MQWLSQSRARLAKLYGLLPLLGLQSSIRYYPPRYSGFCVKSSTITSSNISMAIPELPLNDGTSIPSLGFGTGTSWYKDEGEGPLDQKLIRVLKTAIGMGFNHIDCADCYGTEEEVGLAIKESGVTREKLFVTTKVLDNVGDIPKAIDTSLAKLQMEYVDLYLIHTPYYAENNAELQRAWTAMEAVKKSGKAKSIGVSNFQRPHLEAILEVAKVIPTVNQLELHPYLQRADDYVPWMKEHGIEVSAFKGLAPLTVAKGGPLDGPLSTIAKNHNVDTSSVLLKWHMTQNFVPITTTDKTERMKQYLEAIKLDLSAEEQEEITQIGLKHHYRWWGTQFFGPEDRS